EKPYRQGVGRGSARAKSRRGTMFSAYSHQAFDRQHSAHRNRRAEF
ncbi:LOW QUALITY PROTEIN: predicted protein, partial [Brucella melitensis bv. 3 str. Ether]